MTRLALQYGITAFDTAPHYHPSEKILGASLKSLEHEYPRGSYKIITKCGKYSPKREDHLLDEETLRGSIKRSLRRFGTDYLDVVCECIC
jgi:D-arabinose 1-dehydrogenase